MAFFNTDPPPQEFHFTWAPTYNIEGIVITVAKTNRQQARGWYENFVVEYPNSFPLDVVTKQLELQTTVDHFVLADPLTGALFFAFLHLCQQLDDAAWRLSDHQHQGMKDRWKDLDPFDYFMAAEPRQEWRYLFQWIGQGLEAKRSLWKLSNSPENLHISDKAEGVWQQYIDILHVANPNDGPSFHWLQKRLLRRIHSSRKGLFAKQKSTQGVPTDSWVPYLPRDLVAGIEERASITIEGLKHIHDLGSGIGLVEHCGVYNGPFSFLFSKGAVIINTFGLTVLTTYLNLQAYHLFPEPVYSMLSQMVLNISSIYLFIVPLIRSREFRSTGKHGLLLFLIVSLSLSFASGISSPFSLGASLALNFLSNITLLVSTLVLVESISQP